MHREYDELAKLNLSLSVPSIDGKTKSIALHPKLYSAKKENCKLVERSSNLDTNDLSMGFA